jgi:hypothetical protein
MQLLKVQVDNLESNDKQKTVFKEPKNSKSVSHLLYNADKKNFVILRKHDFMWVEEIHEKDINKHTIEEYKSREEYLANMTTTEVDEEGFKDMYESARRYAAKMEDKAKKNVAPDPGYKSKLELDLE